MSLKPNSVDCLGGGAAPLIPSAALEKFQRAIVHDDLWLWDSWGVQGVSGYHLYTLALSRKTASGQAIRPEHRNNYRFHMREFFSGDGGQNWQDQGCVFSPSTEPQSYYNANIWSGSSLLPNNGPLLFGFTGLRRLDSGHQFLQTIGLAQASAQGEPLIAQDEAISCPHRDYDLIRRMEYYLGPKDELGSNKGEDGGPILAWRDPYLFNYTGDTVQALWSAKTGPKTGAVAHALLKRNQSGWYMAELYPPIALPDENEITQAEVPKIYSAPDGDAHLLFISACDRLYEGQDDSEVTKTMRLYRANNIRGPWAPAFGASSIIQGLPHMFGCTPMKIDWEAREAQLICPVTEMAKPSRQLTIAPIQSIRF